MMNRFLRWFWLPVVIVVLILLIGCSADAETPGPAVQVSDRAMAIDLTSAAFGHGDVIPAQYTCDGDDSSPPLQWANLPEGTESLALIMDDPDAPGGTWVHWVIYDVPGESSGLPENVPAAGEVPGGGTQGNNSWRRSGYGGPCPPSGSHRYVFTLYALDQSLDLGDGATKDEVLSAMEGHVLDEGQHMGTYSR